MKKKLLLGAIVTLCAALAFALAGCQQPEPEPEPEPEPADVGVEFSTDPFYVLLVGNDSREGTIEINKKMYKDGKGRSDVIMLLRVDPVNHLLTTVSVPRDTTAWIGDQKVKINESYHVGGIQDLITQVEWLTGVHADYYFDVGFVGFEEMVDALGGVNANVPVEMSLKDIVHGDVVTLYPGEQTLNGPQALVYARVRKIFVNMDQTRQYHNRELIENFIRKAMDNPEMAAEYMGIVMQYCDTNMSAEQLAFYVNDFIANKDQVTFLGGSGPTEGDTDPETNLWLTYRDEELWHQIMAVVDQGGDPTTVFTSPIG